MARTKPLVIRRTDDDLFVERLDQLVMGNIGLDKTEADVYWIAHESGADPYRGRVAGYAIARDIGQGIAYLNRAGVMQKYRGHGLQKRLIRVRLGWARRKGLTDAITYVHKDNMASMRNLIACGFLPYRPEFAWAGTKEFMYFKRTL